VEASLPDEQDVAAIQAQQGPPDLNSRVIRYATLFNTPDGRFVLEDLRKTANRPSYEPGMKDPQYEVYYREGLRAFILLIDDTVRRGIHLMDEMLGTAQAPPTVAILDDNEE